MSLLNLFLFVIVYLILQFILIFSRRMEIREILITRLKNLMIQYDNKTYKYFVYFILKKT